MTTEQKEAQKDAELMQLLKDARKELHACQAVIHLAGGFDPAYVNDAKKVLKAIDEVIEEELTHPNKLEIGKSMVAQTLANKLICQAEPVAMRYKENNDKRWQFCHIQGSELLHEFLLKEPLYTQQQQIQTITSDVITDEMLEQVEDGVTMTANWDCANPKEIMAAAINSWILSTRKD